MTITDLLANAVAALALLESLPLGDPRVTLAIQVARGTVALLQSLDKQGLFSHEPIEVDEVGQALLASMQRQLAVLGAGAQP